MFYEVNEIFTSIIGEGRFIGMKAVFVRLSGCNCDCDFCDTDHRNSRETSLEELHDTINRSMQGFNCVHVIFTGGEALLQDLVPIILLLIKDHENYIQIGIETNGLCDISPLLPFCHFIHLGISPKTTRKDMILEEKHVEMFRTRSLKVLYPDVKSGVFPDHFETYPATWFGVQPIEAEGEIEHVDGHMVIRREFLLRVKQLKADLSSLTSKWHISPQIHKFLNMR